ncbi:BURP domain-containing protein BNM2A-like [Hibiscus syriacus]|uniref:BURP domain-containing protein BNM2A-like n=1 Tax=Hibiscus syriacus TaxID=106335 RepID=UPI0019220C05|nr:BURP domain-containing protein BNM2A-like [Hibiscus syriacus]
MLCDFIVCWKQCSKGFGRKFATAYFHKTSNSENHGRDEEEMMSLEDKYATAYFHKSTAAKNHGKEEKVKSLEDKYATAYFHKNSAAKNLDRDNKMMKSLEDKYATAYFHKTSNSENVDRDEVMKRLNNKYAAAYFHKTSASKHPENNDQVKSLTQKYATAYFHKSSKMVNDHNMEHQYHGHDQSAEIGLFTLDELRAFTVGKKLPIFFPIKNHSLYPPFLPKSLVETIPFSSSQVSDILQFFSVPPDSPKGKAVQDTLQKCGLEAAQGETKICATSLESLHGFLSNAFGPKVDFMFISTRHPTMTTPIFQNYTVLETPREIESPNKASLESLHGFLSNAFGPKVDFMFISTRHPTMTTPIFQNYTVLETPREIESPNKVACHPIPYLYAVYFCHFDATETRVFKLKLAGEITGDEVEAVVVCHMDTSGWSSDHDAFRMLGVKRGDAVCHVFSQGNLVWINQPLTISVSAM